MTKLVYQEDFQYVNDTIAREKQLKNWHRDWKIELIEKDNPDWKDLCKPLKRDSDPEQFGAE
ncbi:MAG: hypothetical protein ACTH3E_10840 [Psychroflexus halocasei]